MRGGPKLASSLIVVSWCVVMISCSTRDHVTSKRTVTRWCGPSLAQALHLVCDGSYQTMWSKNSKKSSNFDVRDLGIPVAVEDEEDTEDNSSTIDKVPMFPFFLPRLPIEMRLAKEGLRVRRGVSDECCHRGCTMAVLQTYCLE